MDDVFEDFMREELSQLQERLLEKHASLMSHGLRAKERRLSSSKSPDMMQIFLADGGQKQLSHETTDESLDVFDLTGKLSVTDRWGSLAAGLLNLQEDDQPRPKDLGLEVRLMPVWQISWHEAERNGRKRRAVTQNASRKSTKIRFNDVFTDQSSQLQKCVVGPDSQIQLAWACIAMLLIVWDMTTIPLELFPIREDVRRFIDRLALVSWVYWLIDVPTHLIFGVQIGGAIEMRPHKLAMLYARSWLLVDLLVILVDAAIILLEQLQDADANPLLRSGRLMRTGRFVKILRMVRLIRLLRVAKLERRFMLLANHLLSAYTMMFLRLGSYLLLMLAVNHLIACCWYGVGTWTKDQGNWLQRSQIDETSFSDSYVAAMHWSLCQFTPSTNPIAPDNGWERFFAIWVILLAMACFSSFVGSISSSVNTMRMARREELMHKAKLERFFMERKLSVELFSKVKDAVRYDSLVKIRMHEEDVGLIQNIPERFKIQLHAEMFMPSLRQTGIWLERNLQSEDTHLLRSICHKAMKEHTCKIGQEIFLSHAKCHCVYVLQSGEAQYGMYGHDEVQCEADTQSAVLCLPALWAEWNHWGHLAASSSCCNYVSIDATQFGKLATAFGGEICEYLKILGVLIVHKIEHLQEAGEEVSDLFDHHELRVERFVARAEHFAMLKASGSSSAHFVT